MTRRLSTLGLTLSPRVRTALWAHSIASWATCAVLRFDTLRQPGRAPLDGQFWTIFGVTAI